MKKIKKLTFVIVLITATFLCFTKGQSNITNDKDLFSFMNDAQACCESVLSGLTCYCGYPVYNCNCAGGGTILGIARYV